MASFEPTTPTGDTGTSINIRPGVSILSVLQHLNYQPWFAIAEFVDNAVQSFLTYREELHQIEGEGLILRVDIELDPTDGGRIVIRDNAAGIHEKDYARAFRPAEIPPDRGGLSEFGMGMKSAACWFAQQWSVRTSALGESIERMVSFDIAAIVQDNLEELSIQTRLVPANDHYTEVVLTSLGKRTPKTQTIRKIKEHLASIYRIFIRDGILILRFGNEELTYTEPAVLVAPFFKEPDGEPRRWYKLIDLDFGLGLRAHGFAALRAVGSTSDAGFALFRRNRLIQGSRDEGYRPEFIFGKSNSYTYQRLFGELNLEGFDVSHTKDGIRWDEHEEIVLDMLKEELNKESMPLLSQSEGYRARLRTADLRSGAEAAAERTADVLTREAPQVLQHQLDEGPDCMDPLPTLLPTIPAARRIFSVQFGSSSWQIELEISNDRAISDWVDLSVQPILEVGTNGEPIRRVGIRLAYAHPFMERFSGTESAHLEPLLRVAVAIVLAEITARDSGVRLAGTIRRNVNELLRDALSKP